MTPEELARLGASTASFTKSACGASTARLGRNVAWMGTKSRAAKRRTELVPGPEGAVEMETALKKACGGY
jgi:hypothetical protein